MKVIDTNLEDVKILEPSVFGDDRGFFLESWSRSTFAAHDLPVEFVQDNHSRSAQGVLRGLHYQIKHPQGKLVRVTQGEVFDVAVDLRQSSSSFGQWAGVTLSEQNKRLFWVPPGFAHGFYVLSDSADFQYKCSDIYSPEHERCLLWSDVTVGIEWPLISGVATQLSDKDKEGQQFDELDLFD
ncbi:MAG: dTDP-4-dehydrorhamnose 3,5-epimerase [Gammaproteobacteria bacterium]|nr:dTDP-4-dehydrorhamnose 3,5-epimerase [Gammaproteobacteria bacterium]